MNEKFEKDNNVKKPKPQRSRKVVDEKPAPVKDGVVAELSKQLDVIAEARKASEIEEKKCLVSKLIKDNVLQKVSNTEYQCTFCENIIKSGTVSEFLPLFLHIRGKRHFKTVHKQIKVAKCKYN